MKPLAIFLAILCQFFLVIGQLFFKRAMSPAGPAHPSRGKATGLLLLGIVFQSLWFFLWLGLLAHWDLSKIFPFEGLNPALLVLGAWLVLKEKLTIESWVGVGLICLGIVLVSQS